MVRCLLSLWNKITGRKSQCDKDREEKREKIRKLREFLDSHNDEETWILGLSLCLEELPQEILEYRPLLDGRHHNMYSFVYNMHNTHYSVKKIINTALRHENNRINWNYEKDLFLRGTVLTIDSVLYEFWC